MLCAIQHLIRVTLFYTAIGIYDTLNWSEEMIPHATLNRRGWFPEMTTEEITYLAPGWQRSRFHQRHGHWSHDINPRHDWKNLCPNKHPFQLPTTQPPTPTCLRGWDTNYWSWLFNENSNADIDTKYASKHLSSCRSLHTNIQISLSLSSPSWPKQVDLQGTVTLLHCNDDRPRNITKVMKRNRRGPQWLKSLL